MAALLVVTAAVQWQERGAIGERTLRKVAYLSHLLAQHAARSVEAVDVIVDVFVLELARREWHSWPQEQSVAELKKYRSIHQMPQLRDLLLFDRQGDQVALTAIDPVPRINVKDRPYFKAHLEGAERYFFGPYIGRNTGTYTFAITRRITDSAGGFDGVMMASFEPAYFESFCASRRFDQEVEAVLVDHDGVVIAACLAAAADEAMGRPAGQVLAGGGLTGSLPAVDREGTWLLGGEVVAVSPLEGIGGLSVVVVYPLRAALVEWKRNTVVYLSIGIVALATLMLGAIIIRSQIGGLRSLASRLEGRNQELVREIAEREEAEEDLRQNQNALAHRTDELERSNQELQQFAYAASHDLQEPLNTIEGFLGQLASRYQGKLSPEADEFIGFTLEAAARLKGLIRDLIHYSRIERLGQPLRSLDMDMILAEVRGRLASRIAETGASVTSGSLPVVDADPDQMVQVLESLIGNALKFCRKGQPPMIHVGAEPGEGDWIFSVRDNGIGIPGSAFEKVFVIFQRLHPRHEFPGNGIGLSLSKRIVERHGGRMWVESDLGKGSVFKFSLPARREEAECRVCSGAASAFPLQ